MFSCTLPLWTFPKPYTSLCSPACSQIIEVVGSSLPSCTANEASRLGRFLKELLQRMFAASGSEEVVYCSVFYPGCSTEHCMGLTFICLVKAFLKHCSCPGFAVDFFFPAGRRLTFAQYQLMLQMWQRKLFRVQKFRSAEQRLPCFGIHISVFFVRPCKSI